jgi:hypothetical protein
MRSPPDTKKEAGKSTVLPPVSSAVPPLVSGSSQNTGLQSLMASLGFGSANSATQTSVQPPQAPTLNDAMPILLNLQRLMEGLDHKFNTEFEWTTFLKFFFLVFWAYFIRFGKRHNFVEEFFSIRALFRRENSI